MSQRTPNSSFKSCSYNQCLSLRDASAAVQLMLISISIFEPGSLTRIGDSDRERGCRFSLPFKGVDVSWPMKLKNIKYIIYIFYARQQKYKHVIIKVKPIIMECKKCNTMDNCSTLLQIL